MPTARTGDVGAAGDCEQQRDRHRLRGVGQAAARTSPEAGPVTVQRRVL